MTSARVHGAVSISHPSWLLEYCRSQIGMFLIPIDALSKNGMDAEFSADLTESGVASQAWVEWFDRAFSVYWERAESLHARAPSYWFPPRVQHICIVTKPDAVRPYFQPLFRSSWLLYSTDFEPEGSSPELSVFLLFQAERMSLVGEIVPALHDNLSYFSTLSADQRSDLEAGCKRTPRPDRKAYRYLGDALSWLGLLNHKQLNRPGFVHSEMFTLQQSGLIVQKSQVDRLRQLQEQWGSVVQEVFARHQKRFAGGRGSEAEKLGNWLQERHPRVLISGADGETLWDPDQPGDQDELIPALATLTSSGAERIRTDLELMDRRTRKFHASLTDPDALVDPAPFMNDGGLSYIHSVRKLIAYDIGPGPNENRLWEPSRPFERLMLGARTVHEWGHLAAESGWVLINDDQVTKREKLAARIVDLFDEVIEQASPRARGATRNEMERLSSRHGSVGRGLLNAMDKRVEDYMANLVARRLLSGDEMDTYVRNNVWSPVGCYLPKHSYMQILRDAYEFQYLGLSRITDPKRWFYSSTGFDVLFVKTGFITRVQFEAIADAVASMCSAYSIDESKFDFSGE